MEELKKFKTKDLVKFIVSECDKLSTDDLCRMQAGLAEFFNIYRKYNDTIYGSSKRLIDLLQYASLISDITIKRLKKDEELPY